MQIFSAPVFHILPVGHCAIPQSAFYHDPILNVAKVFFFATPGLSGTVRTVVSDNIADDVDDKRYTV